jgi:thiol-disulfide isomerase/thioredoxin
MAHSGKQRVVLATIAAASLLVAELLGYDIARRASLPAPQFAGPIPATGSTSPDTSANPLALSVLDQPRPLPEIRFADDQGRELTLADFRGRVALLNIWATWCVPCRKEMPALDRLQVKLGVTDFLVIPLSIDREGVAPVRRFYEKLGLEKLGIYVDPSSKGSRPLATPGVPTTLLIDRQGRETARKMGAAEWDGPEMVSLVERTIHARSASDEGADR